MATVTCHIDFETFSELDLTEVGGDRYHRDPSTETLMAAYSICDQPKGDQPVDQWVPVEGQMMPRDLREALRDPSVVKLAWNSPFEKSHLEHVVREEVRPEEWRDPMILAMCRSFPGKLEKVGDILGIAEEDKKQAARGKALMRIFSFPTKPTLTNNMRTRTHWFTPGFGDRWDEYKAYNINDVKAERAIWRKLLPFNIPNHEWQNWLLDWRINQLGIPINREMVDRAVELVDAAQARRIAEMKRLTGLKNPNSNPQLLGWLQEQGYVYDDLKAGHVKTAYAQEKVAVERSGSNTDPKLMKVLELRLEVSKTSVKKYAALQRALPDDNRIRGAFQFAGAQRTWRYAGRIFQPQNLARPTPEFETPAQQVLGAKHIREMDPDAIELVYSKPIDLLSSCIRTAVQADPGYVFIDADLNAIENRVLGWMAGDQKILDVYKNKRCPYVDFATYMFGGTFEELWHEFKILKNKKKRTTSKPAVLGCFGADTPVLTKRGWTRIVDVLNTDEVFDGQGWTTHGGVAYRGEKNLLSGFGLHATSDHKIKVGKGWKPWGQAKSQPMFGQALATASGQFSATKGAVGARGSGSSVGADAVSNGSSRGRTSSEDSLPGVPDALLRTVAPRSGSGSGRTYSTFSQIVSTLRERGARTPKTVLTSIMGGAEFVCGSVPPKNGWAISSMLSARTGRSKLTEKTTMATTSREISVSLRDPSKIQTSGPSWDIVNAGTRSSFVVLTDAGPVVAHNCGYMLSAGQEFENEKTGEMEATGLLGYAWNMGVKLTQEEATTSVTVWRDTFEDAVDYWRVIEVAAKRCIRTGEATEAGPVEFRMRGPFLEMWLPSGRPLSYFQPRIENKMMPWGKKKPAITYMGLNDKKQWVRLDTHPGKLTENADQAISRDLLDHGKKLAWKQGIRTNVHIHDQLVAMVKEREAEEKLRVLIECMETRPSWARSLPLGSEGHISPLMVKDG